MELTYASVAKTIDHSLLSPNMTPAELADGCRLALVYDVASVCIKPFAVTLAAEILKGSTVAVGTTIGFPHGGHSTAVKVFEAERAMADGATELDMVINIGQALGGDWAAVRNDISAIVKVAHAGGGLVKVIFENCYLQPEHITKLCEICGELNADYVKTSTGYGTGGATHDDLRLMRKSSPDHVKVKAAGGIRTLNQLLEVVELGCTRVGASKTAEILDELNARIGGIAEWPSVTPSVSRGTHNDSY